MCPEYNVGVECEVLEELAGVGTHVQFVVLEGEEHAKGLDDDGGFGGWGWGEVGQGGGVETWDNTGEVVRVEVVGQVFEQEDEGEGAWDVLLVVLSGELAQSGLQFHMLFCQ